ncbi:hypothetical protein D3C77_521930 [compost metagenome]
MHDRQTLFVRQLLQQFAQVALGLSRFLLLLGKQFIAVVQWIVQGLPAALATQMVGQFITGNGLHPGGQRLFALIAVAGVMHRQQHLLKQVLKVIGASIQAFTQKTAQVSAQLLQKLPIRLRIAV